jgi:hypothetical protein
MIHISRQLKRFKKDKLFEAQAQLPFVSQPPDGPRQWRLRQQVEMGRLGQ